MVCQWGVREFTTTIEQFALGGVWYQRFNVSPYKYITQPEGGGTGKRGDFKPTENGCGKCSIVTPLCKPGAPLMLWNPFTVLFCGSRHRVLVTVYMIECIYETHCISFLPCLLPFGTRYVFKILCNSVCLYLFFSFSPYLSLYVSLCVSLYLSSSLSLSLSLSPVLSLSLPLSPVISLPLSPVLSLSLPLSPVLSLSLSLLVTSH